jgi:hypothetical protein
MSRHAEKRLSVGIPGLKSGPGTPQAPLGGKKPFCGRCYGKGIAKDPGGIRYVLCHCGRPVNSWAAHKLAEQAKLDKRYEEIKTKGW